jgi:uncharacterized Zn finger protein
VRAWWARRWVGAVERIVDPARLSQGRWHARNGRVVRLDVRPGEISARLEGGQALPRAVRLRLPTLAAPAWERAVDALAAEARYEALLLAGDFPEAAAAALDAAGAGLFPRTAPVAPPKAPSRGGPGARHTWDGKDSWGRSAWGTPKGAAGRLEAGELTLACDCSEARTAPCKHIAAAVYAFGARLEGDPFLLFAVRGRGRPALLAALRERRAAAALEGTLDAIAGLAAGLAAAGGGGSGGRAP